MQQNEHTQPLLRIGVAFAFLYPAISAIFNPYAWIAYFPPFLLGIIPDLWLLHMFGIIEVFIALWIFSGRNIFVPSALAFVILASIILLNPAQMDVIFRDIPIALMALLLMLTNKPQTV